jgi:hypothetical protein
MGCFWPFWEKGHCYILFTFCLVEEKKLPLELLTYRSALRLPQPEAGEAASAPALKAALNSAGGQGTVALAVETRHPSPVGCSCCRPAGRPEAAGDLPVSSEAAGSWLSSQLGEKLPAVWREAVEE